MKAFPDAKVVLTVRDPKRWYESVKNSILKNRAVLDDFAGSIFLTMIGGFKYLNMVNQISNHKIQGTVDVCHFEASIRLSILCAKDSSMACLTPLRPERLKL